MKSAFEFRKSIMYERMRSVEVRTYIQHRPKSSTKWNARARRGLQAWAWVRVRVRNLSFDTYPGSHLKAFFGERSHPPEISSQSSTMYHHSLGTRNRTRTQYMKNQVFIENEIARICYLHDVHEAESAASLRKAPKSHSAEPKKKKENGN